MCIPLRPAGRTDVASDEYVQRGAKALASGFPAANSNAWGLVEAASDIVAEGHPITPMHALMKNPAWYTARAAEHLRHQQEAVAKNLAPEADSFTEQAIYSGLTSLVQNLLTLPLGILARKPNAALVPMAALTGGGAYGEARDSAAVPTAAREQIEAALKKARLPITEESVRHVWSVAQQRQRAQKDPGAEGP